MKLRDSLSLAFASYGLLYGGVLGVAVTIAFFAVEDRLLDHSLSRAQEQVDTALARNIEPVLTRGLTLYKDSDDVPPEFRTLPIGRHEVEQYRHVSVFEHPSSGAHQYLVLDETTAELDRLLSRILFATLLALVAAVVTGLLIARWLSGQLMQPMNTLIRRIDALDLENPEIEPLPRDDEIGFLSRRFSDAIDKLNAHDRREKDFTRFASHELRSPITVLRGTVSILRKDGELSERSVRAIDRADAATARMSRLVEAFLYLGRASEPVNTVRIGAAEVAAEIGQLADQYCEDDRSVSIKVGPGDGAFVSNRLLLSIVLENLLANAIRHGNGTVRVTIAPPEIVLCNAKSRIAEPGHGFGLEISERICERLGFRLQIDDGPGEFTARLVDVGAGSEPPHGRRSQPG